MSGFPENRRLVETRGAGQTFARSHQNTIVKVIEEDFYLPETGEKVKLQEHQRRILNHVFTPVNGKLRYTTVIYSTPKKEGKTTVGAMCMYGWAKTYGGQIYSIANDKEQAEERAFTTLIRSLRAMREKEPSRFEEEVGERYQGKGVSIDSQVEINNPRAPATIRAIPCDPYGEAGGMQTFTLWDELWAYRSQNSEVLWTEMQPLPPGVGNVVESIRMVVTYAGWLGESDLLWREYERVVKPDVNDEPQGVKAKGLEDLPCYVDGRTFVYWDETNRMPWKTPEFLEEARQNSPTENEYLRIWCNKWTTGEQSFVDIKQYDELCKTGDEMGLYNRALSI